MRNSFAAFAVLLTFSACGGDTGAGTTEPPSTTPVTTGTAAERGEALFNTTCIACHGPGGEGIEGLGKPLTTSEFAAGLTDGELLAFIDAGRPADDPLNTTRIAMPPRGGNPSLSDADLLDIIAYVRTLSTG
jgi:mono/diheme cytochrome c family protein